MRSIVANKMAEVRKYDQEFCDILISVLHKIVKIVPSTLAEDMKMGIDFKVKIESGDIASRIILDPAAWDKWHAIIIRCSTTESMYSEYQKIVNDTFARYYVYRWLGSDGKTRAWALIDIEKLRMTYEFIAGAPQRFYDGGTFIEINVIDLARTGCIIGCNDVVRDYLFSHLSI